MSYQEKFKAFLASAMKFDSEESRNQIISDAEGLMTDFIRAKVTPAFALYAVEGPAAKGDWYREIRQKLTFEPSLATGFDGTRLKAVLKHYANFVQSKAFLGDKATVGPGEKPPKPAAKGKKNQPEVPDVLGETEPSADDLSEGALTQVSRTQHERNRTLRQLCLRHFGAVCQACGMSFEKVYGEVGRGYIEVHHLSPISETDSEHAVDPKADLVPLCANCHAMIHRLMAEEKKATGAALEGAAALAKLKACLGLKTADGV